MFDNVFIQSVFNENISRRFCWKRFLKIKIKIGATTHVYI